MPFDPGYDEDDDAGELDQGRRFKDFDCPDCAANNPYDDGFGHGDEIRCYYCGQDFRVDVTDSGRLRLKAL
jgi:hypothetical protein